MFKHNRFSFNLSTVIDQILEFAIMMMIIISALGIYQAKFDILMLSIHRSLLVLDG